ncbi:hypothetical protein [Polycyclovorans algicola]|uniref:hypothetical protein n=1 Tax=Polycyclovorans algicola TaxID=616992 RepID=UPI0004A75543|nr:hypothetical protein [Polycyclovorans algicola]
MDAVVASGLIGALGSIVGALSGAALGYKLANRSAEVSVLANFRFTVYYLKGQFCAYLPVTIANDGAKGSVINEIQLKLKASNGQEWLLSWQYFAAENPMAKYAWVDLERATPILVHGNSGFQHTLKFFAVGDDPEGLSNVALVQGKYQLIIEYRENGSAQSVTRSYSFTVDAKISEVLETRRRDPEDNTTVIFGIKEDA